MDFFPTEKKTPETPKITKRVGDVSALGNFGRFKACVSTAQSMSNKARNAGSACGTTFLPEKIPTSSMNPESHFI